MQDVTTEFAKTIISKAQDQIQVLIGRQWPEISRIIEKDEEITISASFKISNREAEEGTQAAKDHRIRLAISFSEKFSDAIESDLDAHPELPLGENEAPGQEAGSPAPAAAAPKNRKPRQTKTQNAEATTPLEQALAQAAAGCPLPLVKCILPEGDGAEIIHVFTEAAGSQGWPITCISLLTTAASEADTVEALKQTLGAHIEKPVEAQEADPALAQ